MTEISLAWLLTKVTSPVVGATKFSHIDGAAKAVRDWAFKNTKYDCLYSYMKYTNIGSFPTAIANGMKKIKEYPDEKNIVSYAYAITRDEWNALKR